jgi:hypothetical protein
VQVVAQVPKEKTSLNAWVFFPITISHYHKFRETRKTGSHFHTKTNTYVVHRARWLAAMDRRRFIGLGQLIFFGSVTFDGRTRAATLQSKQLSGVWFFFGRRVSSNGGRKVNKIIKLEAIEPLISPKLCVFRALNSRLSDRWRNFVRTFLEFF